ncbi:hypothetical protein B0H16DRAFT_1469128 [Mycena metata]|uniref:Uncharacterized protein n=1 Tax=Mycena metata TaxID=1033252 RepID=A0AAD7HZ03_9AGAR|nr:hypothetical protein B0H16DRAFT_1469128 [Mycena metata]
MPWMTQTPSRLRGLSGSGAKVVPGMMQDTAALKSGLTMHPAFQTKHIGDSGSVCKTVSIIAGFEYMNSLLQRGVASVGDSDGHESDWPNSSMLLLAIRDVTYLCKYIQHDFAQFVEKRKLNSGLYHRLGGGMCQARERIQPCALHVHSDETRLNAGCTKRPTVLHAALTSGFQRKESWPITGSQHRRMPLNADQPVGSAGEDADPDWLGSNRIRGEREMCWKANLEPSLTQTHFLAFSPESDWSLAKKLDTQQNFREALLSYVPASHITTHPIRKDTVVLIPLRRRGTQKRKTAKNTSLGFEPKSIESELLGESEVQPLGQNADVADTRPQHGLLGQRMKGRRGITEQAEQGEDGGG